MSINYYILSLIEKSHSVNQTTTSGTRGMCSTSCVTSVAPNCWDLFFALFQTLIRCPSPSRSRSPSRCRWTSCPSKRPTSANSWTLRSRPWRSTASTATGRSRPPIPLTRPWSKNWSYLFPDLGSQPLFFVTEQFESVNSIMCFNIQPFLLYSTHVRKLKSCENLNFPWSSRKGLKKKLHLFQFWIK